ncbi:SpoIIE family protein phosphatase [Lentzea sp. BCCO 10_0061]|uniref:SpoIIE family protein phosphatase n=1 Tax=Lentzea sokolovensis TaxID=3095429 RepID=A0ABU4UQS6_9PSEU|nr:SpoIIE family protein phosphatase [Lentzea sp. BCCO 10_0061]MDX8141824.1 SpoIIE family protein phosphatase [Lentzea sp. BCCO 10_0061]
MISRADDARENFADLYEHAPCGYLSTSMDGTITKVNGTLLGWLGIGRDELVGRRRFADLLTVGGRIYHETHFAPMLRMHGEAGGIALELVRTDGTRFPVLVSSTVKTSASGAAEQIRTTVFDAHDRRSYEQELLRALQLAEQERDRVQLLATTLQRTLLPPSLPDIPGMDVAAYYHPASADEVGGDFYDLFPLADGTWAFFLGDVSGKGAEAAVVTSLVRYTLRAAAVYDPHPVAVLEHLNTVLVQEQISTTPRFCTALHGLLELAGGGATITLGGGGHPPALLIRHHGAAELLTIRGGQLIGALPDARFAELQVHLRPGDTLLLYSDGLTEARTHGRVRYDEEELRDFADTLDVSSATETVAAVSKLLAGFGVDDDTALLALSVNLNEEGRS